MDIVLVILYLVIPVLLLVLQKRLAIINKLGAVTIAYIIGVILGNSGLLPTENTVAQEVMGPAVILSIPLLLFATDLKVFRTAGRNMLVAFGCCILAVTVATSSAALVFGSTFDEVWTYSAMAFGVYTGGTINLSAIGMALDVPNEAIIMLSAADLAWGGLLLLLILTVAKPFLSRFFKHSEKPAPGDAPPEDSGFNEEFELKGSAIGLAIAILVAACAAGISFLITGHLSELLMYVGVTALGLACSAVKSIHRLKGTYAMGNFLLIVFCLAIGSLARIDSLIEAGIPVMLLIGYVLLITISLQVLLSRWLKVDVDSVIITSTAGLYGPPFIAPVARSIQADRLIPVGITLSLIGFAVGNYGGLLMGHVLKMLLA